MATPLPHGENGQPAVGDVLVTSERGVHYVSVIPHAHRVTFNDVSQALQIAVQWARAYGADVWHTADGQTYKMRIES